MAAPEEQKERECPVMTEIEKLLANPMFEGKSISEALDYCVNQDAKEPTRFRIMRAQLQDDEELVRKLAGSPEIREGLWRMHHAGRINSTCEAVAMHFPEFAEIRDVVVKKIERLLAPKS